MFVFWPVGVGGIRSEEVEGMDSGCGAGGGGVGALLLAL